MFATGVDAEKVADPSAPIGSLNYRCLTASPHQLQKTDKTYTLNSKLRTQNPEPRTTEVS